MIERFRQKKSLGLSQTNLATNCLLVASLVCLSPAITAGQTFDDLVGQRVRAKSTDSTQDRMVGIVLRTGADSIVIRQMSGENAPIEVSMPLSTIVSIDVSRGKLSNARIGALIGAVAGLGAGLSAVAGWDEKCDEAAPFDRLLVFCDEGFRTFEVVIFTITGALVGAGIGYLIKTERWNRIDISQYAIKPSLNLNGQIGMKISLSF